MPKWKRITRWKGHCLPYHLALCCQHYHWQCPPRLDGTTFSPPSLCKYQHWKKKLLSSNLHYRKCCIKDHEFFLNPLMTWPFKPYHFVVYQVLGIIEDLRSQVILFLSFGNSLIFSLLQDSWTFSSLRIIQEQLSMLSLAWIIMFICFWKLVNLRPMCWNLSKLDSGASFGLTPYCANFINYVECDIDVKDISKLNKVICLGTALHKFTATNGDLLYFPVLSYHLPSADICLFSPQAYHQLYGGSSELDDERL